MLAGAASAALQFIHFCSIFRAPELHSIASRQRWCWCWCLRANKIIGTFTLRHYFRVWRIAQPKNRAAHIVEAARSPRKAPAPATIEMQIARASTCPTGRVAGSRGAAISFAADRSASCSPLTNLRWNFNRPSADGPRVDCNLGSVSPIIAGH
jgi:hypothetical protein